MSLGVSDIRNLIQKNILVWKCGSSCRRAAQASYNTEM